VARKGRRDDVFSEMWVITEESRRLARPEDMNSAIHQYSAAQRHTDAIREARRNPPRAPQAPPSAAPAPRFGLIAVLTRRIARPHALRPVFHRS
jgi:hypothetical protein